MKVRKVEEKQGGDYDRRKEGALFLLKHNLNQISSLE